MTQEFIRRNSDSPTLILFFAGWAMDASDFQFLKDFNDDADILICHNYLSLDFDEKLLDPYSEIKLIGYSLGVWVASYVFQEKNISFSEKIAVNGTKYPIDDARGIPVSIYDGTEKMLSEASLMKFFNRMFGNKGLFREYRENVSEKNIEELKSTLRLIRDVSKEKDVTSSNWDRAIISQNDAIFPTTNQERAWYEDAETILIDTPHFAPDIFNQLF